MKKIIKLAILSVLAAAPVLPASAQEAGDAPSASELASGTALAVVRFNQRNLNFERSVGGAAARAMAIKPEVMFDVVLKPGSGSGESQENLQKVVQALRSQNVPEAQIRTLTSDQGPHARYDEVRIYVR